MSSLALCSIFPVLQQCCRNMSFNWFDKVMLIQFLYQLSRRLQIKCTTLNQHSKRNWYSRVLRTKNDQESSNEGFRLNSDTTHPGYPEFHTPWMDAMLWMGRRRMDEEEGTWKWAKSAWPSSFRAVVAKGRKGGGIGNPNPLFHAPT